MWAAVVVMLGLLTGPEAIPITEAGTFSTEAACQSAIAAAVPGTLDPEARASFERGERRYVCVRVREIARN